MSVSPPSSSQRTSLPTGTRPTTLRGIARRCASILTKAHGTLRATLPTEAECSSPGARGAHTAGAVILPMPRRASSYTARGSSGDTITTGTNGPALLVYADCSGEAWVRANREAIGYDRQ